MTTPVPDFDAWRRAVDLEFDGSGEGASFRAALGDLWRRVQSTEMKSPGARILETVENEDHDLAWGERKAAK